MLKCGSEPQQQTKGLDERTPTNYMPVDGDLMIFHINVLGSISGWSRQFFTDILHNGSTVCLARHQLHPNSVVHADSRSKSPPATSLVDFVSTQALPLAPERFLRDWTMAGSNVFGTNVCQKTRNQTSTKKHYIIKELH